MGKCGFPRLSAWPPPVRHLASWTPPILGRYTSLPANLKAFINAEVIARHPTHAKALFESLTDSPRVKRNGFSTARALSSTPFAVKPVTPSSMTSGVEPVREAITGQPQAMASIMARPIGSLQSTENSRAAEFPFSCSPIRR
jgi:hypothetical protein